MRPIFNDGKQDAEHLLLRNLEYTFHTQQKQQGFMYWLEGGKQRLKSHIQVYTRDQTTHMKYVACGIF